jgi:hypothetical protein
MKKEKNPRLQHSNELPAALEALNQILRETSDDITYRGALLKDADWQGKQIQTLNPSVKLQRETVKTIIALRNLQLQESKRAGKGEKVG